MAVRRPAATGTPARPPGSQRHDVLGGLPNTGRPYGTSPLSRKGGGGSSNCCAKSRRIGRRAAETALSELLRCSAAITTTPPSTGPGIAGRYVRLRERHRRRCSGGVRSALGRARPLESYDSSLRVTRPSCWAPRNPQRQELSWKRVRHPEAQHCSGTPVRQDDGSWPPPSSDRWSPPSTQPWSASLCRPSAIHSASRAFGTAIGPFLCPAVVRSACPSAACHQHDRIMNPPMASLVPRM